MSGYNMELDTNNHPVFRLYYYLVLVTKYRRQVLEKERVQRLFLFTKRVW